MVGCIVFSLTAFIAGHSFARHSQPLALLVWPGRGSNPDDLSVSEF
jgi:hypothetical protein